MHYNFPDFGSFGGVGNNNNNNNNNNKNDDFYNAVTWRKAITRALTCATR